MTDLADVSPKEKITSARQNLINDYVQDGTHKLNTLSVDVGGTVAIDSSRNTRLGKSTDTKTDTYNVLTTDIAKTLVMNSGDDKIFNLPSVGASNVRLFFTFIKIGVGKVTIQAADSDIIVDSGAGDTIYNDEATETYASITLQLISETHWVIVGASGTWVTTD